MERPHRAPSLVGPLILISIGVIFLLNNLGYLNWNIWLAFFRLWPLLLIIIGLDILIGRRSMLGSIIVALIFLALLAAVILYGGTLPGAAGPTAATETIGEPLQSASRAQIDVEAAAALVKVHALQGTSDLLQGTVPAKEVTKNTSLQGGTASVTLRPQPTALVPFMDAGAGGAWDLGVTTAVPVDLRVTTAAGETRLDLTGIQVSHLEVSAGLGQEDVILPTQGRFDGKLSAGMGTLRLQVPAGLAVRLHITTGLGNRTVPASLQRQGDIYTSPDYDTAENRADLDLSCAMGLITIVK